MVHPLLIMHPTLQRIAILLPVLLCLLSGCVVPYRVTVPSVRGMVLEDASHQALESARVQVIGFPGTASTSGPDRRFKTKPATYWQIFSCGCFRIDRYQVLVEAPSHDSSTQSIVVFRPREIDLGTITLKKANP